MPALADAYLGARLGGYEIVERIGEGGMGVVYRAHASGSQAPVAIKVIKRGMDTASVLRRFHNERRILAALDHPNIARLLDAGITGDGVPYFVMEYIVGVPVTRYCDEWKLQVRERLQMFRKICSAVQCAHDIHVVHRDIKPGNILVGADGEPKLLDFGIAKILDRDLLAVTQDATMTLGPVMTPRYASPEHARGEQVTPSSDIYSLGVLLYELLTGHFPQRVRGHSAHALLDAICHQEPEPPSVAVNRGLAPETTGPVLAANRGTMPTTLRRTLTGDLDAILLLALQKSPARRYPSVAEFSADVGRYLDGAPVHARKSGLRYAGARAWLRWGIVAALVVLIVAGLAIARRWRAPAGGVAVRPSVAVLGFENLSHQPASEWLSTALTEMLSTELAAGGSLRLVPGELVSRVKLELGLPNTYTFTSSTLARLRRSLSADYLVLGSYLAVRDSRNAEVRLDLRLQDTRTGEVLTAVSETQSSSELLPLVTRTGLTLRRRLGAGDLPGAESQSVRGSVPEDAEAARNYAEGLERLRRFDTLAARDLLRNAVTAAPGHALSHAALAAACGLLGYDMEARDEARKALDLSAGLSWENRLSVEGRYFETTRAWDKAVDTYRRLRERFPDNLDYGLRLVAAQVAAGQGRVALATVNSLRSLPSAAHDPRVDVAGAEAALSVSDLSAARAAARRAVQSGSAQGFRILAARALLLESRVLLEMGDPQRSLAAAAESERAYQAAGHRQGVAWALNESAGVLTQLGEVSRARARFEEALAVCKTIGDQSCIGTDLDSLGVLRRRQGDLHGAVEMHQQALEIRRNVGDRAGVATSLYNLCNVLEILGDLPRAREAAAESLELRKALGQKRAAALTMSRLANIRRRQGELAEAGAQAGQAVSELRQIGDRGGIALSLLNLSLVLMDQGNIAQSRTALEEALAIRRQQRDKNNTAQVLEALSAVALHEDRPQEALNLIGESISLRQELGEKIALAQSNLMLGKVLLEQGRAAEAEAAAREAAAVFSGARAAAWEAAARLVVARSRLAQADPAGARNALDAAGQLMRDSKDVRLLLGRDIVLGCVQVALGRKAESAAVFQRALAEAGRLQMAGLQFEARLAMAQAGQVPALPLATDARQAGFLLIARKAAAVAADSAGRLRAASGP